MKILNNTFAEREKDEEFSFKIQKNFFYLLDEAENIKETNDSVTKIGVKTTLDMEGMAPVERPH